MQTELERLITREGIQIAITPGSVADGSVLPSNYSSWTVTLRYQKRKYVTPFFTVNGVGPQSSDVIYSLCQEVGGLEAVNGNFEAWATRFGYSIDSRSAYTLWKSISDIAPKFKMFLGTKQREFFRAKHRNQIDPFTKV